MHTCTQTHTLLQIQLMTTYWDTQSFNIDSYSKVNGRWLQQLVFDNDLTGATKQHFRRSGSIRQFRKKEKGTKFASLPLPAARVLCLDVDGTKAVPIVDDDETADNNSAASFVPQTLIQLTPFTDLIV